MSDARKIETDYTREPTCPRCGYVVRDAWELSDETEIDCGNPECEVAFKVFRNVEVTYTTELVKP